MYIPIKNVPIKIGGYAMNSPKLQLYYLMIQLLLLPAY
jgi:hypothetical protein